MSDRELWALWTFGHEAGASEKPSAGRRGQRPLSMYDSALEVEAGASSGKAGAEGAAQHPAAAVKDAKRLEHQVAVQTIAYS